MPSRIGPIVIACVVLATAAFIPLSDSLSFEGQRNHGDSKEQMLPSTLISAALTERSGPAECQDTDDDGLEDALTVNGVTFECENIDLLEFIPNSEILGDRNTDALTGGGLSDIWGWTSPETGNEYVLVGATNGVAALRVNAGDNPEYLGHVFNTGAQLIWFDIKVNNDHAYIVSESPAMGMKILDLTLLDSLPAVPAGTTAPLPVVSFPLDIATHNVVIDEAADVLYLVGGIASGSFGVCPGLDDGGLDGLFAFDISEPKLPVLAGCHTDEGYVHDAHCTTYTGPDADYQDRQICVSAHEDGVAWVDVTDPAAMETIFDTKTAPDSAALYPEVAYSHQGWMSEDQTLYFHGDELDENGNRPTRTFVFDMTDLDDVSLAFINEPGGKNIDHNMYTHRGLLFQSNYTAGLQVFDQEPLVDETTGEQSLEMVAEFDVFPDDRGMDRAVFAGTWSNYPYFESGTLAVTATEDGLFFLRLDPAIEAAYPVAADG
ncbi:MAG: choice-of-anchor B family protein [Nitriliruptorales bacterium]|nr:choice-of-anchor B family protein [Nitriliruptorales bacterium]